MKSVMDWMNGALILLITSRWGSDSNAAWSSMRSPYLGSYFVGWHDVLVSVAVLVVHDIVHGLRGLVGVP